MKIWIFLIAIANTSLAGSLDELVENYRHSRQFSQDFRHNPSIDKLTKNRIERLLEVSNQVTPNLTPLLEKNANLLLRVDTVSEIDNKSMFANCESIEFEKTIVRGPKVYQKNQAVNSVITVLNWPSFVKKVATVYKKPLTEYQLKNVYASFIDHELLHCLARQHHYDQPNAMNGIQQDLMNTRLELNLWTDYLENDSDWLEKALYRTEQRTQSSGHLPSLFLSIK